MRKWLFGAAIAALTAGAPTRAANQQHDYNLDERDLGAALRAFATASGRNVVADSALIAGKSAKPLHGTYDDAAAIAHLLKGSGLDYTIAAGAFVITPAASDSSGKQGNDILVVGTRIRGAAPVGSSVSVIDREAMGRSGRGTIQGLLETIPSNFGGGQNEATQGVTTRNGSAENTGLGSTINLRGLGSAATLVLFDGSRPALGGTNGTFADVSLIPQIAVDRIEVLSDGASAIYGTDAVAGVVNFRFRNRFEGIEVAARVSTAGGDFGERQLGTIMGTSWDGGGVVLAYQFAGRGNLQGARRSFATSDLRPFGGPDYRSKFTTPATIVAADGSIFAIPDGQNGRSLTASQLIPGSQLYRDNQREDDLLPRQRSHAVFGSIRQEITDSLDLYGRALFARRDFKLIQPSGFEQPVSVPTTNAFYVDPIGTAEPVTASYDFGTDLGHEYRTGSVEGLSLSGGLEWSLGPWRIEASGNYGTQRTRFRVFNILNQFRLAKALADSNPATAYNVFGDGNDTNPATIAAVRGDARLFVSNRVWSGSTRADGPLLALPTGLVRLAAGYEHRDERIRGHVLSDTSGAAPATFDLQPGRTHRRIDALYVEMLLPLSGGNLQWMPGSLDLSAAVRSEWYNDFGRTINPKLGLAWAPMAGMKLRGSWGTSFHAPGFGDLVGSGFNLYQPLELVDPQSPTGTSTALGLFGYVDGLKPEKAESWSAGIDLNDWPAPGITASVSYFSIGYRDRIATATSDIFNFLARRDLYGSLTIDNPSQVLVQSYFDSPFFANTLGVTPGQIKAIVNGLTQNMSRTKIRGLDFDIGYSTAMGPGTASIGVSGTRLISIDQQITATSPRINVVGTFGNPVKLRLRGRAGWTRDGFDAGLFLNHVGSYQNQTVTPVQRVGAWTTVDARIAYSFHNAGPLKSAQLALSAINLFDRAPPFTVTHYFDKTVGYDPEQSSPTGRILAVEVTARW